MATYMTKSKEHVIKLTNPKEITYFSRVGTGLKEVSDSLARTRRRIERALDKERSGGR